MASHNEGRKGVICVVSVTIKAMIFDSILSQQTHREQRISQSSQWQERGRMGCTNRWMRRGYCACESLNKHPILTIQLSRSDRSPIYIANDGMMTQDQRTHHTTQVRNVVVCGICTIQKLNELLWHDHVTSFCESPTEDSSWRSGSLPTQPILMTTSANNIMLIILSKSEFGNARTRKSSLLKTRCKRHVFANRLLYICRMDCQPIDS